MTIDNKIPVIDLKNLETKYEDIADQILDASRNIGFFCITNYSKPSLSQLEHIFEMSENFFAEPVEKKVPFGKTALRGAGGYSSLSPQKNGDKAIVYDTSKSEAFDILPPFKNQHLPDSFMKNKKEIDTYYKDMHSTAMLILDLLACALKIPKNQGTDDRRASDYFSFHHRYEEPNVTARIRLLHYPKVTEDEEGEENEDQLVCPIHTDHGSITLVRQKDIGGLQVDIDGVWTDIPPVQNAIVVNIGGTLEYWSENFLKAAKHRVIATPELKNKDRYSAVFFVRPQPKTKLDHIPSPLIPISDDKNLNDDCINTILTSEGYLAERNKDDSFRLPK